MWNLWYRQCHSAPSLALQRVRCPVDMRLGAEGESGAPDIRAEARPLGGTLYYCRDDLNFAALGVTLRGSYRLGVACGSYFWLSAALRWRNARRSAKAKPGIKGMCLKNCSGDWRVILVRKLPQCPLPPQLQAKIGQPWQRNVAEQQMPIQPTKSWCAFTHIKDVAIARQHTTSANCSNERAGKYGRSYTVNVTKTA